MRNQSHAPKITIVPQQLGKTERQLNKSFALEDISARTQARPLLQSSSRVNIEAVEAVEAELAINSKVEQVSLESFSQMSPNSEGSDTK